jgi:DNA-binding transcriptional ArsR family regulator
VTGLQWDPLIDAAGRALAVGDPLAALKLVALRDDPPALALRGIAMAQLGELARARELLRAAVLGFGPNGAIARARCIVGEAEIALVSRDLNGPMRALGKARAALEAHGDQANATHAGYLEARWLLLIGRLDEAEQTLAGLDVAALSPPSRAGYWLVVAGTAIRRVRAGSARIALDRARRAARDTGIPSLAAEVERANDAFEGPAARLIAREEERLLELTDVEALIASNTLVIDACRNVVRSGTIIVPLAGRPVLFALARALAEAWPGDVSRETLIGRAFRAHHADDTHRARLRVEIGRLRKFLIPLAELSATKQGFVLRPDRAAAVAVLAPPVEGDHAEVLALLADGEAWSSSALALALGVSPRSVQRALEALAEAGQVECFGRGRACRWVAPNVPGFPTSLLLPGPLAVG